MFEVSLFSVLTFVTFIDAYRNRLISLVLKMIPQNPLIKTMSNDIIDLEKELSTISMAYEFAKHAKLYRRIRKLKDDKRELVKEQAFKTMKIRYFLMTASKIIIFSTLIILVWLYRNEPVAQIPSHWLWPASSLFSWFTFIPGSISVPCWIAISSNAAKAFAKHF